MIDTPATFLGIAGAAFLLASFTPAALSAHSGTHVASAQVRPATTSKGDRIAARKLRAQVPVATVELPDAAGRSVVLRDGAGRVLYRSDPMTSTTSIARDTEMPLATTKPDRPGPAVQQPAEQQQSNDRPGVRERRGPPIGCEAVLSALVDRSSSRPPGLCLAGRDGGSRAWL